MVGFVAAYALLGNPVFSAMSRLLVLYCTREPGSTTSARMSCPHEALLDKAQSLLLPECLFLKA